MRPVVANVAQFADQRPLGAPQSLAEDLLPLVPHHRQQARRVPLRLRAAGEQMSLRLGYARDVYSSRKIQTRTFEDVAFRYLSGDQYPDRSEERRVGKECR